MIRASTASLLLLPALALSAVEAFARGGGGCLLPGTKVETLAGPAAIESLKAGDRLPEGEVLAVYRIQADRFVELRTSAGTLKVTGEHPVETAPGVFRLARLFKAGDAVLSRAHGRTASARVLSSKVVSAPTPAYNLTVGPHEMFSAGGLSVHNKGCFLPDTPILDGTGKPVPLRDVKAGDRVLAFNLDGAVTAATVRQVFTLTEPEYFELTTETSLVKATAEHPFYAGDGTFKTVAALRPGDPIYLFDGKGLVRELLKGKRLVEGPVEVYNLQTDAPNTFFASRIAVHNKGGGCFAAGTRVRTPKGERPIESLEIGDEVVARDAEGRTTVTRVRGVFKTASRLLELTTEKGKVVTTGEHPFAVNGGYLLASKLKKGEALIALGDAGYERPRLLAKRWGPKADVYNLEVGGPHVFIADSFLVHNKGGGGGYHSSGGSHSSGPDYCQMARREPLNTYLQQQCESQRSSEGAILVFQILLGGGALLAHSGNFLKSKGSSNDDEDLDYSFSRSDVKKKSLKTERLLEFLSKSDATVTPKALVDHAERTFRKLQECWEAREYADMKPLMMESLWRSHVSQLEGMKRAHEIDKISSLDVHWVEPVHLRYTNDREKREFTVLVEASARDHYVDDRTGDFLRGDEEAATFQEFWTFQWEKDGWRLRAIEQTRESDALRDENFVETFTPDQLGQVYGEAPGKTKGPSGTWQSAGMSTQETKVHRLLNFLGKTDKAWDEDALRELGRQAFTALQAARETGLTADVSPFLSASVLKQLNEEIAQRDKLGLQVLYRNLCVRKVELMLVRNFADNGKDEIVLRISAHAQRTVSKGSAVQFQDPYVQPWTEYWVFGREGGGAAWKLREILPPAEGDKTVGAENVDQDSTPDQLKWYYSQERAL